MALPQQLCDLCFKFIVIICLIECMRLGNFGCGGRLLRKRKLLQFKLSQRNRVLASSATRDDRNPIAWATAGRFLRPCHRNERRQTDGQGGTEKRHDGPCHGSPEQCCGEALDLRATSRNEYADCELQRRRQEWGVHLAGHQPNRFVGRRILSRDPAHSAPGERQSHHFISFRSWTCGREGDSRPHESRT